MRQETHHLAEQHDILASHEEDAAWYVAVLIPHEHAFYRVLQHKVR